MYQFIIYLKSKALNLIQVYSFFFIPVTVRIQSLVLIPNVLPSGDQTDSHFVCLLNH